MPLHFLLEPSFNNYKLILEYFIFGEYNLYFSCHLSHNFLEIFEVSLICLS